MADIMTIGGSPSYPSRSSAVLDHIRNLLTTEGYSVDSIEVRALPAEALLFAQFNHPDIQLALAKVANARAVIIASPVYKASYTGVLKAFLDLLPQRGFADKIIFPIASGGSPAHLLTIDFAIKPVLSALGAQYVLSGLYIQDAQLEYLNGFQLEAGLQQRLDDSLRTITRHLNVTRYLNHSLPSEFNPSALTYIAAGK